MEGMREVVNVAIRSELGQRRQNRYIERDDWEENEEIKQPIRERVASFLLPYQPFDSRVIEPRVFSLPGTRWRFENFFSYEARRRGAESPISYVACERNWVTLERSRCWMPRSRRGCAPLTVSMRSGELHGFRTDRARILHVTVETLLETKNRVENVGKRGRSAYANANKMWTGAWFDFQGPLTPRMIHAFARVGNYLAGDRTLYQVPVAVTLMLGRELPVMAPILGQFGGSTVDRRAAVVAAALSQSRFREAMIADAWSYLSSTGCPMMVVLCVLELRDL